LHLETNAPEWVDLWEVYREFRRKEMTSREWRKEMSGNVNGLVHRLHLEDDGRCASDRLAAIEEKLDKTTALLSKIDANLTNLVKQHTIKEFYTTDDICKIFGKASYTVREWCRLRRINAKKVPSARGGEFEWRISHEELVRIQNEGLLPIPTKY
jgi:hypothetical protein